MGPFRTMMVTAVLLVAPLSGAAAADAFAVPVTSSPVGIPVADATAFDWTGFYAGIFGVGQTAEGTGLQLGAGLDLGVNAQFEFLLVGAEVALQGLTGDVFDTAYGQILGKAGVVITDDVLLYAAAGYGIDLGAAAANDVLLGGGVEYAVNEDFTVRAQYLHGFAVTGGEPTEQITLGTNFHF
ncbi:outer membrane protein [Devosia sp.]|uniref:outer membrane protein n=1 Tax=Devosia sp. TaxID=1871048 RepID=UPI002F0265B6